MLNYINLISLTLPAPFILINFFKSYFCSKTYLGISMRNSEKTSTRKGKDLFSHTM